MAFKALRESKLRTAKAWAIQQLVMSLRHYVHRIWMVMIRSRGFRNKERFARAIKFYLGGLDMHPA